MYNEKEVQEALDRLFNKLIEEVQKKNGVLVVDEIGKREIFLMLQGIAKNGVLVVDEIGKREIFLMLQGIAELSFEVMAQDIGIVIVRRNNGGEPLSKSIMGN